MATTTPTTTSAVTSAPRRFSPPATIDAAPLVHAVAPVRRVVRRPVFVARLDFT